MNSRYWPLCSAFCKQFLCRDRYVAIKAVFRLLVLIAMAPFCLFMFLFRLVYVIAEEQHYSSHYFETALDLRFCIHASDDQPRSGFYLIQVIDQWFQIS
jgi:hypothetical protein